MHTILCTAWRRVLPYPSSIMNVFLVLGLVLVSTAITVDATECLRHIPVGPEKCPPPQNALILYERRIVQCCSSSDLFPMMSGGDDQASCDCVPREVLCKAQPERCYEGVPESRYIKF